MVFCAPKGQLLLAQGSALGMCDHLLIAPCKGSCFPFFLFSILRFLFFGAIFGCKPIFLTIFLAE